MEDNLAVCKANELCNANGLDAISTGASIGFVMECFERGILSAADTGGLELHWGDAAGMVRAVELIARREGFGNVMADGVARMSRRLGPQTEAFNLTVKGQELPMHEPRLKHVLGLGYAVAPVGADHMMNVHDTDFTYDGEGLRRVNLALTAEQQVGPLPAQSISEEKMRVFFHELNWMHFQDCAVNCHFYPYDYQQFAQVLSGVTGLPYSLHDILAVGERAQTLARLFNLREGFTADDDKLPRRVRRAFSSGPLAGKAVSDEQFAWARGRYYEMMGWDGTGTPSSERIAQLGLEQLLPSLQGQA